MATLEDIVLLLATHLVEQDRELLGDVKKLLRGHSRVLNHINEQVGGIMGINEENQAALDEIAATLSTQFAEVVARLDELEAQPGAQALNFQPLRDAVQAVADVVPDVVEEPPVEPAPEV